MRLIIDKIDRHFPLGAHNTVVFVIVSVYMISVIMSIAFYSYCFL